VATLVPSLRVCVVWVVRCVSADGSGGRGGGGLLLVGSPFLFASCLSRAAKKTCNDAPSKGQRGRGKNQPEQDTRAVLSSEGTRSYRSVPFSCLTVADRTRQSRAQLALARHDARGNRGVK
jgi:hypothetical protein